MAASPEVMGALRGQPSPAQAPAPSAGGMLSPSEPGGMVEAGKTQVMVAMKILENTISVFGATSEQGKAVMKAVSALAKTFGENPAKSEGLVPAEMRDVMQGLAGPGALPPGVPPPPPGMPPGGAPPIPPPGGPPGMP